MAKLEKTHDADLNQELQSYQEAFEKRLDQYQQQQKKFQKHVGEEEIDVEVEELVISKSNKIYYFIAVLFLVVLISIVGYLDPFGFRSVE